MFKKTVSAVVAGLIAAVFMASCSAGGAAVSSTVASSEAAYSEIETSSMTSSEKEETSSEESSSKKEESSSSKPESSEPETSSRIEISRPTASRGESVTLNVGAADALGIGVYHFNISWTKNYGNTKEDKYREFEDVLKAGYFNTVIVSGSQMLEDRLWEICEKYKVSVWMSLYSFYNSNKTNIDSYMQNSIDKYVSVVKESPAKWDLFCGFHHEENIWRGQSNADYLEVTRALYQRYGKRNFSVFATGEFTNYEGNENQIEMDAANMKKINPSALKFTTDLSFDSYAVDVRTGAPNGNKYIDWQDVDPSIVDGESYYRGFTKAMLKLVEHDVNVWFFPCSYTTYLWGGVNGLKFADEAYCIAHLNFFDILLKEQKFQGGLFLYTYTQFSSESEKGLQSHLVLEDESGKQLLQPDYTQKWEYYSSRLKDLTTEYKKTKAKHATFK